MSIVAAIRLRRIPVAAIVIAVATSIASGSGSASAQSAAEAFIQQDTDKALAILKDKSLSDSDKRVRVENLMATLLDLRRMALFTLGSAAKTASAGDIDAFVAAYREFALANYSTELMGYMGQTLRMTSATQRAPGDYVVNAVVADPTDRSEPPAAVSFRVLDEGGGKFALVDASLEGVWFTLAQRDDFSGFLGQNGGDISRLVAHLKDLAAHPQAGLKTAR
jgi:phospholipid transport system substrate-binding protein